MKTNDQGQTKTLTVAILAAIFGAFYSLIQDLSNALPFVQGTSPAFQAIARIVLAVLIALVIFAAIFAVSYIRRSIPRLFGFIDVSARWFPSSPEARIDASRKLLQGIVADSQGPLYLASVSGEWDIRRAFTEKELKAYVENNLELRVLLAHPQSATLKKRCELEKGQELTIMRHKIIQNTDYLLGIGGGKCKVRWYLTTPTFHILANSKIMHFSPFVNGLSGHETRRYVFDSENPLYWSLITWFEETWDKSLDPIHEMKWTTKQARATRAVFLDRDDTLIKDISYFGNSEQVEIEILPGVIEGLRMLSEKGFRLIIISNQQSVGLNVNNEVELALLTKRIKNNFEAYNIYFDAFYYCKHTIGQDCNCRKPKPQLFEQAAKDFNLSLNRCYFIGNSSADSEVSKYLPSLKVYMVDQQHTFLEQARKICQAG